MPYSIEKQGNKYVIKKKKTGEVVGHSDTREMAEKSVRAREMAEANKVTYKFNEK